jgi:hypothetical protein
VKKVDLFSLRRDANSEASLNTSTTVRLVEAPEIIEAYNEEHDESLELLPADAYTLANTAVQKTSDGYTFSFASGSFAQEFTIMLNGSKWLDLTKKYAVAFKIVDASGNQISAEKNEVIAVLAIANKYDGIYSYRASMTASDRPTINASGVEWEWPGDVHLVTTGENVVNLYDNYGYHAFILPIQTATGGVSGFGQTNPKFVFDLETNEITSITNAFPNPSNGRAFVIDPTGPNYFDPETHNVFASFFMTQPGFSPLKIRLTLTYKKAR